MGLSSLRAQYGNERQSAADHDAHVGTLNTGKRDEAELEKVDHVAVAQAGRRGWKPTGEDQPQSGASGVRYARETQQYKQHRGAQKQHQRAQKRLLAGKDAEGRAIVAHGRKLRSPGTASTPPSSVSDQTFVARSRAKAISASQNSLHLASIALMTSARNPPMTGIFSTTMFFSTTATQRRQHGKPQREAEAAHHAVEQVVPDKTLAVNRYTYRFVQPHSLQRSQQRFQPLFQFFAHARHPLAKVSHRGSGVYKGAGRRRGKCSPRAAPQSRPLRISQTANRSP